MRTEPARIAVTSEQLVVTVHPALGGRICQIAFLGDGARLELLLSDSHRAALNTAHPDSRPATPSPVSWGCYPMTPWPGRIAAGRFEFEGRHFAVPTNVDGAAIHGTTFDRPWDLTAHRADSLDLEVSLGQTWPWSGSARQRISVKGREMTTRLEVHAGNGARFPAGAGWHPWFLRREREPAIELNASSIYETGGDLIPTGSTRPVEGADMFDLTTPVGSRRVDQVYTGVSSPILITWSDLALEIDLSSNLTWACLYTPEEAFCVEPMSCAADAFNLEARGQASGVSIVEPGSPLVVEANWRFWPL